MNENKANVKVLTKEDVIKLSNYTKRQEFLSEYESWGVWLEISEINVQIFKALLPNGKVIFVTRFKNYMRYEAEAYFEKVLSAEKKGSILYQETCFEMGEVFYFTERLKEAIQCYHSCNPKLLNKGEELFLRLGYCLAEMKKTSEPVRFYTKCRLNGRYMAANKDLLPSEEIPVEEFEEYSKLCEALGEADWKQNVIKI